MQLVLPWRRCVHECKDEYRPLLETFLRKKSWISRMGKDEVLAVCRAVSIDASGAQIIIPGVDSVAGGWI